MKEFEKTVTYNGDKYLVLNKLEFLMYVLKIYRIKDYNGEVRYDQVYVEAYPGKIFDHIKYGKGYENIYINLIKYIFKDYENKEKNIEKEQLKILKEWGGVIS